MNFKNRFKCNKTAFDLNKSINSLDKDNIVKFLMLLNLTKALKSKNPWH